MTRRSRKARSGGPLLSHTMMILTHRGDAKRLPELVDTERAGAEMALRSERL